MPSYEQYGFPNRPRRFRDSPGSWSVVIGLTILLVLGGLVGGYFLFRGERKRGFDPMPSSAR